MQKYLVRLAYLGAGFRGWQKQDEADERIVPSIQATFENTLESITGERSVIVASGRTDAGVHAREQVLHFKLKKRFWQSSVLERALNSRLPRSVRVISVTPVSDDFHAQHSVTKKQYSYYFQQGPCALPFHEPMSVWLRHTLDIEAMNRAIGFLVGEHDFLPFQARGTKPMPTVRTIFEASVTREAIHHPGAIEMSAKGSEFYWVRIRLVGSGFLKQMVRSIAGTLEQVGEGKRPAEDLRLIIEAQDRKKVGPTALARGLVLEKVWYPEELIRESITHSV